MKTKTYEYAYLEFDGGCCYDDEHTIKGLNELGKQGWMLMSELKDCMRYNRFRWGAFFIREINND